MFTPPNATDDLKARKATERARPAFQLATSALPLSLVALVFTFVLNGPWWLAPLTALLSATTVVYTLWMVRTMLPSTRTHIPKWRFVLFYLTLMLSVFGTLPCLVVLTLRWLS